MTFPGTYYVPDAEVLEAEDSIIPTLGREVGIEHAWEVQYKMEICTKVSRNMEVGVPPSWGG